MPQFADGKAIRHFSQKTMIGNIVEKPDAEAGERASGRQVGKPVKLQYDEVPSSEMGRPRLRRCSRPVLMFLLPRRTPSLKRAAMGTRCPTAETVISSHRPPKVSLLYKALDLKRLSRWVRRVSSIFL